MATAGQGQTRIQGQAQQSVARPWIWLPSWGLELLQGPIGIVSRAQVLPASVPTPLQSLGQRLSQIGLQGLHLGRGSRTEYHQKGHRCFW